MEPHIKHLWNSMIYLTKVASRDANNLRTHYVNVCRRSGDGTDLPRQPFGPIKMCSHCGSLWSVTPHKVHIEPGKTPSSSIQKIIRQSEMKESLPRYRASLLKKCIQNRSNKLIITCLVCSMNTRIPLSKSRPLLGLKFEDKKETSIQITNKKKKKRVKDRTAGLNISLDGTPKPKVQTDVQNVVKLVKTPKKNFPMKNKKNNLDKLKNIINTSGTPKSKRSSLQNFLKELG